MLTGLIFPLLDIGKGVGNIRYHILRPTQHYPILLMGMGSPIGADLGSRCV